MCLVRKELDSRPQKTFGNLTAPSLPSDKIEILNKFSLLQYLYPSPKFEYEIEPTEPVDPIFVKERNFK
jgi:hypothetical protein